MSDEIFVEGPLMFTAVITWVGALFGIAVLVLMAVGPIANDFAVGRRKAPRS